MLKLEKRIRFNENDFDENGNIRASSLLHSFQDIAAEHADILGVGREHLMERGWIWVLSKVKLKVYGAIEADKDYVLTTCPRPKKGLIFPRDYYLRAAMASDTAVLAAGMSQWCIINFLTRKLERNDIDFQGQCIEQAPFEEGIEKIRCSAPQDAGSHLVTEDDLDVNRHVNNCRYADMVSEVPAQPVNHELFEGGQTGRRDISVQRKAGRRHRSDGKAGGREYGIPGICGMKARKAVKIVKEKQL